MRAEGLRKLDPALLGILVIAAAVRIWGIDFGLPHLDARPDETTVTNVAMTFFTGDPNPHFFNYPTLYMYCLFLLYLCYFALGLFTRRYLSVSEFVSAYLREPASFLLLDRLFTVALATSTIFVVYQVASRLGGRRIALVSSFFMALAHLHVRDSHFGVTDAAALFPLMCAMLFILSSYQHKTLNSYLHAGLLSGLAASTKYGGLLLAAPMLFVHLLNWSESRGRSLRSLLDRRLAAFAGALLLAFLLTTPFALLDFPQFAHDFGYDVRLVAHGHRVILGRGWWYHAGFSLPLGLGWSLFLASLAGMPVLLKRQTRKAIILCSFPAVYYAVSARGYGVFLRYALPFVPFLCIAGAASAIAISDELHRRLRLHQGIATGLVAALLILPSACRVLRSDALLATKDSRSLALAWMSRNLPAGSAIYTTGPIWRRYNSFPALDRLQRKYGLVDLASSDGATSGPDSLPAGLPQYHVWSYDQATARFQFNGRAQPGLPQYIITRESPLLLPHEIPEQVAELLRSHYQLEASFRALDMHRHHWFDQQDGFVLPFAGFTGVERPGPNLRIYRRVRSPGDARG